MIITDGPAQMIVAAPPTGHEFQPGAWFLHNTSPDTELYFDTGLNVHAGAGSTSMVLPPGGMMVLTGGLTYWARTRHGTHAELHLIPTMIFGAPGSSPAPPASIAATSGGVG